MEKPRYYYLFYKDWEQGIKGESMEVVELYKPNELISKLNKRWIGNEGTESWILEEIGKDNSTVIGDEFEPRFTDIEKEKTFAKFIRQHKDTEPYTYD